MTTETYSTTTTVNEQVRRALDSAKKSISLAEFQIDYFTHQGNERLVAKHTAERDLFKRLVEFITVDILPLLSSECDGDAILISERIPSEFAPFIRIKPYVPLRRRTIRADRSWEGDEEREAAVAMGNYY